MLVSHADGRRTLYYHLAQNGALVSVGQAVSAGQWIAASGCSGQCYGAHLHFEMRAAVGGYWTSVDPIFEKRFTTTPGRVPFLATYLRESNGGMEVIKRYTTVTHWVEFVNAGGRAWRNNVGIGRVLLGTWNPATHASIFGAIDWPSSWVASNVDQTSVPPGGVGRFTFGLHAESPPGNYDESFNLLANTLRWFDWQALGSFHVPITVILMIVCGGLCFGFSLSVTADIVTRTIGSPWLWLQEVTSTLFIYAIFIGTAVATRRNDHLYRARRGGGPGRRGGRGLRDAEGRRHGACRTIGLH